MLYTIYKYDKDSPNTKENYKGLLKENATEAVLCYSAPKILQVKTGKKPSESLQTPLFLFPSVFLKDLPKSLCI